MQIAEAMRVILAWACSKSCSCDLTCSCEATTLITPFSSRVSCSSQLMRISTDCRLSHHSRPNLKFNHHTGNELFLWKTTKAKKMSDIVQTWGGGWWRPSLTGLLPVLFEHHLWPFLQGKDKTYTTEINCQVLHLSLLDLGYLLLYVIHVICKYMAHIDCKKWRH